jgi:hypothetical protein
MKFRKREEKGGRERTGREMLEVSKERRKGRRERTGREMLE